MPDYRSGQMSFSISSDRYSMFITFSDEGKSKRFEFKKTLLGVRIGGLYEMLIREKYPVPPLEEFRSDIKRDVGAYLKNENLGMKMRNGACIVSRAPQAKEEPKKSPYDIIRISLEKLAVSATRSDFRYPMLRMVMGCENIGPVGSQHVISAMSDGRKLVYERTCMGDLTQLLFISEIKGSEISQREIAKLVAKDSSKALQGTFFVQRKEPGIDEAAKILKKEILGIRF
jgi:hypothetical protein